MSGTRSRHRASVPFALVVVSLVGALAIVVAVRAWTGGQSGDSAAVPPSSLSSPTRTGAVASPVSPTVSSAAIPTPPACAFGDVPTEHDGLGEWNRTLLDTTFRLDQSYAPEDLASAAEAGFQPGYQVRSLTLDDLRALREAAEAAGHPVELIAAYRSYADQADLFERRVAELGEEAALSKTARAGHSEHQLGTTVDFKDRGASDVTVEWGATSAGTWMRDNAWRFGFLESYPDGETSATCYAYEPWHFRYLGRELAASVRGSALTLREYLWAWQELGTLP